MDATPATPGPGTRPITRILLGIDGSLESDRAAVFATQLAMQLSAELVAAHAVGLLDIWPEHPDAHECDAHAHIRALVEGSSTGASILSLFLDRKANLLPKGRHQQMTFPIGDETGVQALAA